MKITVTTLFAAILTLTLGTALGRADQPAAKGAEPKVVLPPDVLTDESLKTMLENMGYTPKVEKTAKGNIYTITIKRGTWTYIIDLSLSPSKTKLWLSGWLSALPEKEPIPADKLLDLLEGSWTYGPAHFRYHRAFRQLNVGLCLDNREMTPAAVRTQIESFMETMKKSELLWNVKKWKASDKVTLSKPGDTPASK